MLLLYVVVVAVSFRFVQPFMRAHRTRLQFLGRARLAVVAVVAVVVVAIAAVAAHSKTKTSCLDS